MKSGINLNGLKAMDLFESLGVILTDQYRKEYFKLPLIIERVGEDTFIIHMDNDEDVPEYLAAVRRDLAELEGKPGRFKSVDIVRKRKDQE